MAECLLLRCPCTRGVPPVRVARDARGEGQRSSYGRPSQRCHRAMALVAPCTHVHELAPPEGPHRSSPLIAQPAAALSRHRCRAGTRCLRRPAAFLIAHHTLYVVPSPRTAKAPVVTVACLDAAMCLRCLDPATRRPVQACRRNSSLYTACKCVSIGCAWPAVSRVWGAARRTCVASSGLSWSAQTMPVSGRFCLKECQIHSKSGS